MPESGTADGTRCHLWGEGPGCGLLPGWWELALVWVGADADTAAWAGSWASWAGRLVESWSMGGRHESRALCPMGARAELTKVPFIVLASPIPATWVICARVESVIGPPDAISTVPDRRPRGLGRTDLIFQAAPDLVSGPRPLFSAVGDPPLCTENGASCRCHVPRVRHAASRSPSQGPTRAEGLRGNLLLLILA